MTETGQPKSMGLLNKATMGVLKKSQVKVKFVLVQFRWKYI